MGRAVVMSNNYRFRYLYDTSTQYTELFHLVGSSTEDSDLNSKMIHRYGIPKSRTLSSSAFMSPIGPEHYRLFEPLAGDFHNIVQQAQGLREEDEDGVTWCTR